MLFRIDTLTGIRQGTISLAYRRWRQPRVRPGRTLRTPIGLVEVRAVDEIDERNISEADARRAGYPCAADLRSDLPAVPDGRLFRIEIGYAGPDPRAALREQAELADGERVALVGRLERMDRAGRRGAWTRTVLSVIAQHPGRRAAELAELTGYPATEIFKRDVRKLKELGLTESLEVGYRLSPRGRAITGDAGE